MQQDVIKKLDGAHLLVAGEVGIDEYIWGEARRISPEAPVPVVEVESQTYKLGLSANVAQNIVSLGAKATLISIRGEDGDGKKLSTMISDAGIKNATLIGDVSRPTLRKVRVIAQRQHVVRVDYERTHVLDPIHAKQFRDAISDNLKGCDGIIVQDYGKGLWNTDTMSFVKLAQELKCPVFVDPSRHAMPALYRGVTLLSPNILEAELLSGLNFGRTSGKDDQRLLAMGKKILTETDAQHVVITAGEWGMVSISADVKSLKRIPTFARNVYDVTGAGDTVIAVLSLMYVHSQPLSLCMQVANAAAGIVVARIGTSVVTRDELREEIGRLKNSGLFQDD